MSVHVTADLLPFVSAKQDVTTGSGALSSLAVIEHTNLNKSTNTFPKTKKEPDMRKSNYVKKSEQSVKLFK